MLRNCHNYIRKIFRIIPKLQIVFYKRYNRFYLWAVGVQYGKRLQVYNKAYVLGQGKIIIGNDFTFISGGNINPICRNIRGTFITMNPESVIEIGDRVGMSSTCLWAKDRIIIGNDVNIGGDCLIMDNDVHPHDYIKRRADYLGRVGKTEYMKEIPSSPVVIEDDVWIGARCQILKGVKIGARSIIAAGSIVTKDIPADCVAGGNPCKVIRNDIKRNK